MDPLKRRDFLALAAAPVLLQGQPHRAFHGEGIAPLRWIFAVLKRKKGAGDGPVRSRDPGPRKAMEPFDQVGRVGRVGQRLPTCPTRLTYSTRPIAAAVAAVAAGPA